MKTVRVGATIPKDDHQQITKIVEKSKSTVGAFVSLAIKELMRNPQAQRKLELDGRRA
jgi:hypothetical protein